MSEVNLTHLILAGMLLAAYVAVTIAHMDGSPLLYVLTGQAGGRLATIGVRAVNGNAGQ